MKNILLLIGIISLGSCRDQLDGDCPKNIPLSSDEINFSSSKNSTVITTGDNQWWWLSSIEINGVWYNDFGNVNVSSANFSVMIDSLHFERRERTNIILKVGQNATSDVRDFSITLQDGNCYNSIRITQNSN